MPNPERILVIAGTLSVKALNRILKAPNTEITVVEFDTHYERGHYPAVREWTGFATLVPHAQAMTINRDVEERLDLFLNVEVPANGIPTHRAFRAASLSAYARRVAVPYLVNLHIAHQALQGRPFDRIIVSAGNGINWPAWREVARLYNLPVQFLEMECAPVSWARRLWKNWNRWKKKPAARLSAPPPQQGSSSNSILCTSERIARLLASEPESSTLPILTLSASDTRPAEAAELAEATLAFSRWWTDWQQNLLASKDPRAPQPGTFEILSAVGHHASANLYPSQACIYAAAQKRLRELKPRLLLCDTQTGTAERMWSLAAQELGIPVVAYVYDQIPNPRLSFRPDYVLSDATRTTVMSQDRGIAPERIIPVCSHRQSRLPTRDQDFKRARPLVLFADSYYSGTCATINPGIHHECYEHIIEAARGLPEIDFAIKFHPLREKKSEHLSFVALDEQELANRKKFIRSLRRPANVRLVQPEVNMLDLLKQTSVLLNLNSTAGHEAFHMGVPVIFLQDQVTKTMAYMRIQEFGAYLEALDGASLAKLVKRLISDSPFCTAHIQNQKHYLNEVYWPANQSITQGLKTCLQLTGELS